VVLQRTSGSNDQETAQGCCCFYQGLVLAPASYCKEFQYQGFRSLLYVEVTDIHNRYNRIMEQGIQVIMLGAIKAVLL
jgi:hypothetical protein